MEEMQTFIWNFRYVLTAGVAFVIYGLVEWDYTKKKIYKSIISAKQLAKEGVLTCGKEQEDWVVAKLMIILPPQVKLFLNEEIIRMLVQTFYKNAIDLLDDGKLNKSNK